MAQGERESRGIEEAEWGGWWWWWWLIADGIGAWMVEKCQGPKIAWARTLRIIAPASRDERVMQSPPGSSRAYQIFHHHHHHHHPSFFHPCIIHNNHTIQHAVYKTLISSARILEAESAGTLEAVKHWSVSSHSTSIAQLTWSNSSQGRSNQPSRQTFPSNHLRQARLARTM